LLAPRVWARSSGGYPPISGKAIDPFHFRFRVVRIGAQWDHSIAAAFCLERQFGPCPSAPIIPNYSKRGLREPEGFHLPRELAALNATDPVQLRKFMHEIAAYGKAANLFAKLDVKRLGKKSGDPCQAPHCRGQGRINLRDVGYGVSRILPILVDTLSAPQGQTFLLRQPEVHLPPRAQAALGSLNSMTTVRSSTCHRATDNSFSTKSASSWGSSDVPDPGCHRFGVALSSISAQRF